MNDNDSTDASNNRTYHTMSQAATHGVVQCFSCFRPVVVTLLFYGCVYCDECIASSDNSQANASEFKRVTIVSDMLYITKIKL